MTAESTPPERPTTTRCLVWAVIALIVFLCAERAAARRRSRGLAWPAGCWYPVGSVLRLAHNISDRLGQLQRFIYSAKLSGLVDPGRATVRARMPMEQSSFVAWRIFVPISFRNCFLCSGFFV